MDSTSWPHVKDVIAGALRRPASEREAFVRDRCDDPELAEEIIGMLGLSPTEDVLQEAPRPDPAESDDDLIEPGARIGPYLVLERIGRGGMGQVFLGSDPRLQRNVALKCVIRSLVDNQERRLRILYEARAAARVNHPNVATIHDVVEHAGGAVIVMEYVEGESLAARLKQERLSIDRVIEIGRQLAAALAAAHAKGVVHRDLKPANVQLMPDGTAKVLDFGIANVPRVPSASAPGVIATRGNLPTTRRGSHPGTPPYMSPEQLLGRAIDDRTDIYSLGVVLFEMATGRRPFVDVDPLRLLVAQAAGAPRADSIEPGVPRPLADIIGRALATDATARYQTAAQIGADLHALERERERSREPLTRKLARAAIVLILVPIVLTAIGLITTTGFNHTFGRTGVFAAESWPALFVWGYRAALPSVVFMTITATIVAALRFLVGLAALVPSAERVRRRFERTMGFFDGRVALSNPAVFAQALLGAGLIALLAVIWRHSGLIRAYMSFISTAAVDQLLPLRPDNAVEYQRYRIQLDVLILGFGAGLYKVLQMRRRRPAIAAGRLVTTLVGALVVVFVLMDEWPYRTFFQNYEFERADYFGSACYVIGESATAFLIFCPERDPPRNRTISRDDPNLKTLGIVGNVFANLH